MMLLLLVRVAATSRQHMYTVGEQAREIHVKMMHRMRDELHGQLGMFANLTWPTHMRG